MKIQRFIGDFELANDRIVSNSKTLIDQIRKVFRLTSGDMLSLCDGAGNEAHVRIDVLARDQAIFSVIKRLESKPITGRIVHIYLAILKKENFEMVVQKATECGVASITPIITERTVKLSLNHERLLVIGKEAAEQSGRRTLPHIAKPITLETVLQNTKSGSRIILDLAADKILDSVINQNEIHILIGPEGGFSPREVNLAELAGFSRASLGELTLRAETAGIIATYIAVREE